MAAARSPTRCRCRAAAPTRLKHRRDREPAAATGGAKLAESGCESGRDGSAASLGAVASRGRGGLGFPLRQAPFSRGRSGNGVGAVIRRLRRRAAAAAPLPESRGARGQPGLTAFLVPPERWRQVGAGLGAVARPCHTAGTGSVTQRGPAGSAMDPVPLAPLDVTAKPGIAPAGAPRVFFGAVSLTRCRRFGGHGRPHVSQLSPQRHPPVAMSR